jgi:hypothetical protein
MRQTPTAARHPKMVLGADPGSRKWCASCRRSRANETPEGCTRRSVTSRSRQRPTSLASGMGSALIITSRPAASIDRWESEVFLTRLLPDPENVPQRGTTRPPGSPVDRAEKASGLKPRVFAVRQGVAPLSNGGEHHTDGVSYPTRAVLKPRSPLTGASSSPSTSRPRCSAA